MKKPADFPAGFSRFTAEKLRHVFQMKRTDTGRHV